MDEIKQLYNLVEHCRHKRRNDVEPLLKAISALEKQIAKKPIINYINTSEDATEIEYTCSVCGTNFVELTPCKEWCLYCGNKIDWE